MEKRNNFEMKKEFEIFFDVNQNTAANIEVCNCRVCKSEQCTCSDKNGLNRNGDVVLMGLLSQTTLSDGNNRFTDKTSSDKILLPIGCRLCQEKFYKPLYYEKHWKNYHQDIHRSEMYKDPRHCKLCDRYFQSDLSLKSHESASHYSRAVIKRHADHGTKAEDPRYCPICGVIVNGFFQLEIHLNTAHGGLRIHSKKETKTARKIPTLEDNSERMPHKMPLHTNTAASIPQEQSARIRKTFVCSTCGLVCIDEKSLVNHILTLSCSTNQGSSQSLITMEPQTTKLFLERETSNEDCNFADSSNVVIEVLQPFEIIPLIPCDDEPSTSRVDSNDAITAPSVAQVYKSTELDWFPQNNRISNGQHVNNQSGLWHSDGSRIHDYAMTDFGAELKIKCTACIYVTNNRSSLKNHCIVRHGFKACPVCDFTARYMSSILEHLKTVHSYEAAALPKDVEEVRKPYVRKPVNCRICGVTYRYVHDYRNHFAKHHPEYSADDMFDNGWKCNQCSFVFRSLKALQAHWINQHKESYSKEMFIDFAKRSIDETRSELASYISNDEPSSTSKSPDEDMSAFSCTICNVHCVNKEQLLLHMALVHDS